MVLKYEEGWLGADGQFFGSSSGARASLRKKFNWPDPDQTKFLKLQEPVSGKPEIETPDRAGLRSYSFVAPIGGPRQLKLFLSYASEDTSKVIGISKLLGLLDMDVWFDKEMLLPGMKWEKLIEDAIRSRDSIIFFLSTRSLRTRGYFRKEIRMEMDVYDRIGSGLSYIVPVRLEECSVPERLREFHRSDYFQEDGPAQLVRALANLAVLLDRRPPGIRFESPPDAGSAAGVSDG